jgi:hypothetical protein
MVAVLVRLAGVNTVSLTVAEVEPAGMTTCPEGPLSEYWAPLMAVPLIE